MDNFFKKLLLAFKDKAILKRILYTIVGLVIFRLLAAIPIPGVDPSALSNLLNGNQLLGFFNIFSGGGLSNFSIVMLGVGPYITASIIFQLLSMMFPKLKSMYHEEGEAGRLKLSQYSRILAVPLAVLQAFALIKILQGANVLSQFTLFTLITNIIIITAGTMLLMWIGEIMTEFGIGNGVSLIIFAGIVASIPSSIARQAFTFESGEIFTYIALIAISVIAVAGVTIMNEAERPIPVTYARQVRGGKVYGGTSTYIPLRITQAGVIPIIFALSILIFPQMIFSFLAKHSNEILSSIGSFGAGIMSNNWIYAIIYFLFVIFFTYFYTAVTFEPKQMSENLQKSGAFLPGIRPGDSTTSYIERVVTRITLVGALFLGIIAVLPLILRAVTGNQSFAIGGTALLIVVSVVLDLVRKIDAQVSMREY